jgi:hypothetical protein
MHLPLTCSLPPRQGTSRGPLMFILLICRLYVKGKVVPLEGPHCRRCRAHLVGHGGLEQALRTN